MQPTNPQLQVLMGMTIEQARAVSAALDVFSRLGIGQIGEIARLARFEKIPAFDQATGQVTTPSLDQLNAFESAMRHAASVLGFRPGASLSIGNPSVLPEFHRAFEVNAVLKQSLAYERADRLGPTANRGVDHDGLVLRYTNDPAPTVAILPAVLGSV